MDDPETLAHAMASAVAKAGEVEKLTLLRAHPDLAGKAAVAGDLTADSASEQSGAGLDRCSPEEFSRFQAYNDAYWEKFGFPFIIAVKGLDRGQSCWNSNGGSRITRIPSLPRLCVR